MGTEVRRHESVRLRSMVDQRLQRRGDRRRGDGQDGACERCHPRRRRGDRPRAVQSRGHRRPPVGRAGDTRSPSCTGRPPVGRGSRSRRRLRSDRRAARGHGESTGSSPHLCIDRSAHRHRWHRSHGCGVAGDHRSYSPTDGELTHARGRHRTPPPPRTDRSAGSPSSSWRRSIGRRPSHWPTTWCRRPSATTRPRPQRSRPAAIRWR